jgi:ribosomal protein S18 acetylase RimI-like enzyme
MHSLDNPVWTALTTLQRDLSQANGEARRFPPEVTLLGALRENSAEAWASLANLTQGDPVTLYSQSTPELPAGWSRVRHVELFQMVLEDGLTPVQLPGCAVLELTDADVPEMSVIYSATRPGRTLCPQIQRCGLFLGVRQEGRLAAMGGLRLHPPGYRELTTVATHPDLNSRGFATAIVSALAEKILASGERPYLTVRTDNERAIAIYQRLGFRERMRIHSQTVRYSR